MTTRIYLTEPTMKSKTRLTSKEVAPRSMISTSLCCKSSKHGNQD